MPSRGRCAGWPGGKPCTSRVTVPLRARDPYKVLAAPRVTQPQHPTMRPQFRARAVPAAARTGAQRAPPSPSTLCDMDHPPLLTRRRFLTATGGALAAAALGDGFVREPAAIELTRPDLLIPGLAPPPPGPPGAARGELLYTSRARVTMGGGELTLVGIDAPVAGEPALAAAVRALDAADHAIWMVHAPGFVDDVPRDRFPAPAAILTGHTHGGQIRLPFYAPYTPYGSGRFVAGWYRDTLAPLYVSRGIGTVTIPARLFFLPELAVFTLRG